MYKKGDKKMKQVELLKEIVEVCNDKNVKVSQSQVRAVLVALKDVTIEALNNNDYVAIEGLVKFEMKEQAGREGIHRLGELKGQAYTLPSKLVPKAKFSPATRKKIEREI